jgi:hypothetical protein
MGRGQAHQTVWSRGRGSCFRAWAGLTKSWVPQAEIKAAETEIALKDEVREAYLKHDGHDEAVLRGLLRGVNHTCVTEERCDCRFGLAMSAWLVSSAALIHCRRLSIC